MTKPLPILPDEEVRRRIPPDDEAGFGSLATARGHLPLRALDVRARLDGLLAQVSLAQTFVNALGEYFLLSLPAIVPEQSRPDNWQTSAWTRRTVGIGQLPGAGANDHFD